MKENETFFQWIGNNLPRVITIVGMLGVFNIFTQAACNRAQKPFLAAARVTVVQREVSYTVSCGKYNSSTCTNTVSPAVHFLYDGVHYQHQVSTDFELRPFRHWGCYWLRMKPLTSEYMISSIVGPAPEQACAD